MSKSPIKQMDQGLVQAYRRAKLAGVPRSNDGMSKAIDSISKGAGQMIDTIKANKAKEEQRIADGKKEGEELATNILETGGSLNEQAYDAYGETINGLQDAYDQAVQGGDKAEATKLLGKLNTLSTTTSQMVDLRKEIASTFDTKTVDGKESPNLIKNLNAEDQNMLKAIMDPKTEVRVTEDGDAYGVEIKYNGKWINKNDIERKLHESQEDVISINDLQKLRDKIKSNSVTDASVNNAISSWDEDETKRHISKVLRTGNMVSLANDDILGDGKSFKENLLESPVLAKIDYASLGLDPNTVIEIKDDDGQLMERQLDFNNDGKLSADEVKYLTPADKAKIVEAYTNPENDLYNEDNTRDLMTNYLTQHMKNNYDQIGDKYNAIKKEQIKSSTSENADEFMKELGI